MVMIIIFYFSFSPAGMSRIKVDSAGDFLCGKAVVHSGDGGAKFSSKRLMCNFVWPRLTASLSLIGNLGLECSPSAVRHGSSHTCTHVHIHTKTNHPLCNI